MTENKYWAVKITSLREQDNGKVKKVREEYLIHAISPTDAEVKMTEEMQGDPFDWSISSVRETKILKVL